MFGSAVSGRERKINQKRILFWVRPSVGNGRTTCCLDLRQRARRRNIYLDFWIFSFANHAFVKCWC